MKRKRVGKLERHGALYSPEAAEAGPRRTPARKRPHALEVEEADVIAEYDLADFAPIEVPEYDAIEIER